jgi:hypothetical protein
MTAANYCEIETLGGVTKQISKGYPSFCYSIVMKRGFFSAQLVAFAVFPLAAVLSGCSAFAVKQSVRVDAIASTKAVARGSSFILAVRNPALVKEANTHIRALAAVTAALESKGQFLAPDRTDPQYVVEVDYGIGSSIQQAYSGPIQEKFLSLSARDFVRGGRGEELWNIRVSVTEVGSNIDYSMPLLAVVALDEAGTDTRGETTVEIPIKSPSVARIRSLAESAVIEAAAAGR